jgi:GNAT superfamily N-acetyltransferase
LFSNNPSLFCLVVEKDNQLIGYATYMKQFSTWDANHYIYMDCLFMTEESRGFGIGEKLINRIMKEAQKLECVLIQWQTPDFNKRAMKFYNRIGATQKSKERFFLTIGNNI